MRTDGEVTFWQFQRLVGHDKTRDEDVWALIDLPVLLQSGHWDKRWREHTASGRCWQCYGEHGFLTETEALDAIPLVRAHERGAIRIVRITKIQTTCVVAQLDEDAP